MSIYIVWSIWAVLLSLFSVWVCMWVCMCVWVCVRVRACTVCTGSHRYSINAQKHIYVYLVKRFSTLLGLKGLVSSTLRNVHVWFKSCWLKYMSVTCFTAWATTTRLSCELFISLALFSPMCYKSIHNAGLSTRVAFNSGEKCVEGSSY